MNYKPTPTVRPSNYFDVEKDVTALRAAMKGFGTDKQTIINILTVLSNEQRQQLKLHYNHKLRRDLIEDLKSELGGKLEDVIISLMTPPLKYVCRQLHKSLKSVRVSDLIIIELLFTKSNEEIAQIVACYEKMYSGESLSEEILKKATSDYRGLLSLLVTGRRDPEGTIDEANAQKQAERLFAIGKGDLSSLEEVFYFMLAQASFTQLRSVFAKYESVSGHTIQEAIKRGGMLELTYIMLGVGE